MSELSADLSGAVVIWTGFGRTAWPSRDEARLVTALGEDVAVSLLPTIRSLESDFYESEARVHAAEPAQMSEQASAEFRVRHPEISNEAVEALAWCYTFDHK